MSQTPQTIAVTVETSDTLLFKGLVKAVSCINDKGPFDILPFHANFISLIKEKVTVQEIEGNRKEFKIGQGVLRVLDNNVTVFIGIN